MVQAPRKDGHGETSLSKTQLKSQGGPAGAEGLKLDRVYKSLQHQLLWREKSSSAKKSRPRGSLVALDHPEEPLSLINRVRFIIPLQAKQEHACLISTGREIPLTSESSLGISLSAGDLGFFLQFNSSPQQPTMSWLCTGHSARSQERQGCKKIVPWRAHAFSVLSSATEILGAVLVVGEKPKPIQTTNGHCPHMV